jgi:hypothetical protein
MAQGGDWAVVLPDNSDQLAAIYAQQQARQDRLQQQEIQAKKEEQARQGVLMNTLGDAFADKDYLTGTQYDPFVRKNLAEVRQKFASEIKANPGMSQADFQFRIQKEMGNLGSLAAGVKTIRQSIKENASKLSQMGIDGPTAEKLAMDRAIYKRDDKGNKVLRSPDEIDPSKDYLSEVMNENPELLVNRQKAFGDFLKSARPYEVKDELTTENNGVTKKWNSDLKLYPFQEIAQDNGKPLLGKDGKPFVRTKSQRVKYQGQDIDLIDEQTFQEITSNPAIKLAIEAEFKDQAKGVPNGTPEAEIIKRKIVYDRLNREQPILNSFKSAQTESSLREGLDAGTVLTAVQKAQLQQQKQNEKKDKYDNSSIGLTLRALAGDNTIYGKGKFIEGEGFDITDQVGQLNLGKDQIGKSDYAKKVIVNPDGNTIKIYPRLGKPIVLSGEEAKDYLTSRAKFNGLNYDETQEKANKPAATKKGSSGIKWK